IDAAQVKWDDSPAQPAKRFSKAGDADTNAFSTAAVGAWNEAQKLPYVGPVVRGISDTIIGGAQLLGQAGNKIGVVDDATLANFERN
ncbi:hypothetical protein ABS198_21615, partial [Acinetobacter baumannii]|uniref:hypothetical protein n=1 Tax=Acinetobacter baumannii TaxID=470 RepID=UPI00331FDFE1